MTYSVTSQQFREFIFFQDTFSVTFIVDIFHCNIFKILNLIYVLIKMILNFFLGIIYCWYAFDWHYMFTLDFWIWGHLYKKAFMK